YDFGNSITISALGDLYATGYYTGTVDFDPSGSTFNLTAPLGYAAYVLKLGSTVGLNKNIFVDNVIVFPNPGNGLVNIDLGDLGEASINVYNIHGQLIHQQENITSNIY
ncbi:MAG: T9SS type A sorting domain-containing protein, partial [Bacteroidetes bacterium]|nr:T9SS type A sorting domain-containing protein [Bacteroidota bacterium]